jgi:hypothetical protein
MNSARASAIALSLLTLVCPVSAEPPAIRLVTPNNGERVVDVVGLKKADLDALAGAKLTADEWPKVARLVVDVGTPEEVAKKQPVAGLWSVRDGALRFEPQFPLVPGVQYRVFCDLSATPRAQIKGEAFALAVSIPKPPPGPRVNILSVYPSANRLPENTLRLYVHFSGPVARGNVYKHFKLVRDDGEQVKTPFLEIDEELWSADGLRLTLLFDPGRVKRGLVPREEEGPILEEGRSYTFTIDANWSDTDGRPLAAGFTKSFSVFAPDDEPVWPDNWKLVAPRPGSDAPLLVRLPKPLDRALLSRTLWVTDSTGKRVPGALTVGGGERVVSFAPAQPWVRGDYKLVINATLEDVCGNRVGEPFEVDVLKPIPLKREAKLVDRPFAVK